MARGYFATVWEDIRHTPHWFEKLLILTLVSFIPVFGIIAVAGYLFGWARDMAWKIHQPMPASILGNADGRQYSRGFFAIVIAFLFFLIPQVIQGIDSRSFISALMGTPLTRDLALQGADAPGGWDFLIEVIVVGLCIVAFFFASVGCMRMSIYGRLSPGLQLGQIWKMVKYDSNGLWRILGMMILVRLCAACVIVVVAAIVALIVTAGAIASTPFASLLFTGGVTPEFEGAAAALVGAFLPLFVVIAFASQLFDVFVAMLATRALGYWTMQFDVSQWKGQNDPLPFETSPTSSSAETYPQDGLGQ